jgi:hypothetical protein
VAKWSNKGQRVIYGEVFGFTRIRYDLKNFDGVNCVCWIFYIVLRSVGAILFK